MVNCDWPGPHIQPNSGGIFFTRWICILKMAEQQKQTNKMWKTYKKSEKIELSSILKSNMIQYICFLLLPYTNLMFSSMSRCKIGLKYKPVVLVCNQYCTYKYLCQNPYNTSYWWSLGKCNIHKLTYAVLCTTLV